jgi:hypothetical protein
MVVSWRFYWSLLNSGSQNPAEGCFFPVPMALEVPAPTTIRDFFPGFIDAWKVKNYYGKFPTLHDCEVIAIHLDRDLLEDFSGPILTIDFHVFDSQAHPDSPDRRVAKLTMRFEKAEIEELRGFQHQNPFSDLLVSEPQFPNRNERRLRFEFGEGWRMKFTS